MPYTRYSYTPASGGQRPEHAGYQPILKRGTRMGSPPGPVRRAPKPIVRQGRPDRPVSYAQAKRMLGQ